MSVKKKWRAQGVKQLNPSDSPRVKYCLASCKLQYSLSTSSFLLIIFFLFTDAPKNPKRLSLLLPLPTCPFLLPKPHLLKKKLSHTSLFCLLFRPPPAFSFHASFYQLPALTQIVLSSISFQPSPLQLLHCFNHHHCLVTSLPHILCRLVSLENKKGSYSRV